MSFFSAARTRSAPKAVARAVITPAVSTMVSDGSISDAEMHQLLNLVAFSPIFTPALDPTEIRPMIDEVVAEVEKSGHEAAMRRAAAVLSPALRETALCFALRIALADGKLEDGEKHAIVLAARRLQIRREVFNMIYHVVEMMQRPADA